MQAYRSSYCVIHAMQVKVAVPSQETLQPSPSQQPGAHDPPAPSPSGSGQTVPGQAPAPASPPPSTSQESSHNPLVCTAPQPLVILPDCVGLQHMWQASQLRSICRRLMAGLSVLSVTVYLLHLISQQPDAKHEGVGGCATQKSSYLIHRALATFKQQSQKGQHHDGDNNSGSQVSTPG